MKRTMKSDDLPIDLSKLPRENFQVPDLAEAVEGWRSWQVSGEIPRYGTAPKLFSVTHSYYWLPRVPSVAECAVCSADDGPGVPGEDCTCGFYSAKTREHLLSMRYHTYDGERNGMYCVLGQVANWGKVVEATQGWRAQYSYPVRLFVPYEIYKLLRPLKAAYGVPCVLENFLKPARAEF